MTALSLILRFVPIISFGAVFPLAQASNADGHAKPVSILIDRDMLMAGFANNHADLYFRRGALADLESGHNDRAMRRLKKAAQYGDKPAQALMGEILWNGSYGQQQNRPAAYAWMDLAAERGYPDLLRVREHYWHALTPGEQALALSIGQKLYAEYGDEVAQPRLARQLRQELRNVTGSRTGFGGNTTVMALAGDSGSIRRQVASAEFEGDNQAPVTFIPGSKYYAQHLWRPQLYFKHQDLSWEVGVTERTMGTTSAGPLAPVKP